MSLKDFLIKKGLTGKLPIFVYRFIGRKIAKKLKLEDNMEEKKKWYQSKSVLTGVVTVLIGLYSLVQTNLVPTLPNIPEWIFALLGSIGIYSRVVADKKIG